ncbi:MAG TPA: type IX secretion system protein PorQ [Flavitalea sp.]|nr:type IX secretion system protein PorQ [Flavitalea sp.]
MRFLLLFTLLIPAVVKSQSIGGRTVYNFLEQANPVLVTGLGGINISTSTSDPAIAFNTPSLLRQSYDQHIALSFQSLYGGIKNYQLFTALYSSKLQTVFSGGIHYFNYGVVPQTDASGNQQGEFRPADFIIQGGFARKYLSNWSYGGNLKFIHSSYGIYKSSGIGLDLSVTYADTSTQLQASLLLRNMGFQLSAYQGTEKDVLPFDIEFGISKKLQNAPIQFSFTAHHLNQFELLYTDTAFNNSNDYGNGESASTADQVFSHIVVSTQVYLGRYVELDAGYNHLRRKELNIGKSGNGLNGFSMGIGLLFPVIELRYARSYYQNNRSFHQVGLSFSLKGK